MSGKERSQTSELMFIVLTATSTTTPPGAWQ